MICLENNWREDVVTSILRQSENTTESCTRNCVGGESLSEIRDLVLTDYLFIIFKFYKPYVCITILH